MATLTPIIVANISMKCTYNKYYDFIIYISQYVKNRSPFLFILMMYKMPNNKSNDKSNKPFYHYPLVWRSESVKRIRFPPRVKYVEEVIPEKEENDSKKKRGRPKKEPRKVVVEDDNIVKWIVENYNMEKKQI